MTHSNKPREVSRRNFIADVAVGATGATGAIALSALLPGQAHAGQRLDALPAIAGETSRNASEPQVIAGEPAIAGEPSAAAEWDLSWIDRLTAKYRAVFDTPEINEGVVFTNATVFLMSFGEVYKAPDSDMQTVIVLRHNGVPLAFNDAMWEKYGFGQDLKVPNADKANPWTRDMATLRGRGAILLACNLAATRRAREIARRLNKDAEEVRADLYANLVPGVIMQHSGVFATVRAQQAGCAFMKSG